MLERLTEIQDSYERLLANVAPNMRCPDVAEHFEKMPGCIVREHLADADPTAAAVERWAAELEAAAKDVRRISAAIRQAFAEETNQ